MTLKRILVLFCGAPHCMEWTWGSLRSDWSDDELREYEREFGWSYVDGRDLCALHSDSKIQIQQWDALRRTAMGGEK